MQVATPQADYRQRLAGGLRRLHFPIAVNALRLKQRFTRGKKVVLQRMRTYDVVEVPGVGVLVQAISPAVLLVDYPQRQLRDGLQIVINHRPVSELRANHAITQIAEPVDHRLQVVLGDGDERADRQIARGHRYSLSAVGSGICSP